MRNALEKERYYRQHLIDEPFSLKKDIPLRTPQLEKNYLLFTRAICRP
jgi:hypothetical protein